MSEDRVFESNGMLWNEGDIPACSYCNRDFDEVESLHETPFSGDTCCEQQECREQLLENVLSDQVQETTEE